MSLLEPRPAADLRSDWGEGPVWWNGRLYWVDIEGKACLELNPDRGKTGRIDLDQRVGFALPCASGRWIWGGDHGLFRLDPATGESEPLADPESDRPANRFNDAAVSPDGRLFAGTIATDKHAGAAALYRLDPDGSLAKVLDGLTNSNGIDWSPDGRTCYHIDTPTRHIRRFAYHAADGALGDPDILVETGPVIDASPDGLCVDAQGHLWVAFCHGGCVIRFESNTGRVLARIDLPCAETTSCCFGGDRLQDLYITTGKNAKQDGEHDGKVFVVKNPGPSGRAQTAFRDAW